MTPVRSRPGHEHDERADEQHERVDPEERPGVREALADARLPAERLADHERGGDRHDRRRQDGGAEQADREQQLGEVAGDRLEGPRGIGRGLDRRRGRRSSTAVAMTMKTAMTLVQTAPPIASACSSRSSSSPIAFSATALWR